MRRISRIKKFIRTMYENLNQYPVVRFIVVASVTFTYGAVTENLSETWHPIYGGTNLLAGTVFGILFGLFMAFETPIKPEVYQETLEG